MSIASKWVLDILRDEFPGIYGGGYNCRKVRNSTRWSQHSWPNALDLTHSDFGYSTDPVNQAFLDEVAAFLVDNRENLSIKMILWRAKSLFTGNSVSDHMNHIHVEFWPRGYSTPPCGSGSLRYQYSTDRVVYGDPGPENGMNETNDPRPTPPPDSTDEIVMPTLRFEDGYVSKGRGFLDDAVAMLQMGLARASHADAMSVNKTCAADGWFGDGTDAAVRSFQRASSLTVDGIAGENTWAYLGPIVPLQLWDGYSKGRPEHYFPEGEGSDVVAIMQMGLVRKHHADQKTADGTCASDGWFGPGTETAVKAFQGENNLVADGKVGRLTWSALTAK